MVRLVLPGLLACTLAAHARPVQILTYRELQDRADVVLVLKVQAITETDVKTEKYGDPNYYQGYKAKCLVLGVLKGTLEQTNVAIPFFQHPKALPGFNGAIPAPFSLADNLVFLAYLKHGKNGDFTAVTGEYDAGLSIKLMFDLGGPVPPKLPPHETKPAELDAAPNTAPPHR